MLRPVCNRGGSAGITPIILVQAINIACPLVMFPGKFGGKTWREGIVLNIDLPIIRHPGSIPGDCRAEQKAKAVVAFSMLLGNVGISFKMVQF